jgi:hypothetical protein
VLRRIIGPKREEVAGNWRMLNEAVHNLHASPNIISVIKSRGKSWVGHEANMGDTRNAYKILIGNPEWKRPIRRPKRRWEDNIRIYL